jgi:hypothetical protein
VRPNFSKKFPAFLKFFKIANQIAIQISISSIQGSGSEKFFSQPVNTSD